MVNKYSKNSANLLKTANEVLKKTGVYEIFSQLGKVDVIGSMRLKLIYRLDIDLLVVSEKILKKKAQNVTNKLIDMGIFKSIKFADYQTFPTYDMPLGFYWELIFPHKNKEWKFDIWYLKPDEN